LKALAFNTLSAAATLPGALLAYAWLEGLEPALPYVLAISAASFIYIATADLFPGMHHAGSRPRSMHQTGLLLAGIGTVALFRMA
jgi:zinc and cadmium transporter